MPTFPGRSTSVHYKSCQALPRSLAATRRISFDFFSFGYLDVSVPRVRFCILCIQIQMTILTYGRVPPFGHLWVNACFQLTKAFRRIPRPSSPLTAKASTVCASLLDHITSITSKIYAHTNKQYEFACVTSLFTQIFNELLA